MQHLHRFVTGMVLTARKIAVTVNSHQHQGIAIPWWDKTCTDFEKNRSVHRFCSGLTWWAVKKDVVTKIALKCEKNGDIERFLRFFRLWSFSKFCRCISGFFSLWLDLNPRNELIQSTSYSSQFRVWIRTRETHIAAEKSIIRNKCFPLLFGFEPPKNKYCALWHCTNRIGKVEHQCRHRQSKRACYEISSSNRRINIPCKKTWFFSYRWGAKKTRRYYTSERQFICPSGLGLMSSTQETAMTGVGDNRTYGSWKRV